MSLLCIAFVRQRSIEFRIVTYLVVLDGAVEKGDERVWKTHLVHVIEIIVRDGHIMEVFDVAENFLLSPRRFLSEEFER